MTSQRSGSGCCQTVGRKKGGFSGTQRLKQILEGLLVLYFFGEDVLDQVEGSHVLVVAGPQSLHDLVVDLDGTSFGFHKSLKHLLQISDALWEVGLLAVS